MKDTVTASGEVQTHTQSVINQVPFKQSENSTHLKFPDKHYFELTTLAQRNHMLCKLNV